MNTLPIIISATSTDHGNREDWRRARQRGIGASDAAAIWGASRWQSPYSVWWSKVGELETDQPDILQRIGHHMEPLIAEFFTEETGIAVVDPGKFRIYTSRECPILCCTPDRLTADGSAVVELKTAKFASAAEWKERIPLAYQIQLQHQMIVCGVELAHIAVLINDTGFKHHTMELTPRFKRNHMAKCMAFWREYVEKQVAPPTDYSEATMRSLAKQFAESRPTVIDLPPEFDAKAVEYDSLSRIVSNAEREKDAIKNEVKAAMGANSLAVCSDQSGFKWSGTNGSRRFTRVEKVRDDRQ